jgi:hypothetical protein
MVMMGTPLAVLTVAHYRQYGGVGWTLYLICAAFAGAYVWGLLMWHLHFRAVMEKRPDASRARKTETDAGKRNPP